MNTLFPIGDLLGFRVRPADEELGFRVRPQDVVPGFNLDEYGLPRQESNWSDIAQRPMTPQYLDPGQTLASQTIPFPTPGAGELARPASPELPDWLYKLLTMPLPRSGVLDPRTGRRIVPYEPLVNLVRSYPTADQTVDGTAVAGAYVPGINAPPDLSTIEPRTTEQQSDPSAAIQETVWTAWPQPPQDDQPYAQPGTIDLQDPWLVQMGGQAPSVSPIPSVRPAPDFNFIPANAGDAGGEQMEQQPPLQGQQTRQKMPPIPPDAGLSRWPRAPYMLAPPGMTRTGLERRPEQEFAQLTQKPTWDQLSRQPSQNVSYLSDRGRPSFGQSLAQSSVDTLVPGAHHQQLARQEFEAGNYGAAVAYQVAALLDAALGVATFGLSTRLGAAGRTAVAEGGALFRRAFESGSQLKGYLGRAPEGMHWHHIVEQSQAPQLGQRAIQSVENVVAIPIEAHLRINAFYSSKQLISHPNTVRDWLRGQSFEKQYEYGVERLREVLGY